LFEFTNNVWLITAPAGIAPEQLDGHPSFWGMLDEVRPGDQVRAIAADRSWLATFDIVDAHVGQVCARLAYAVKGAPRLTAAAPKPVPAGYRIERCAPGDSLGEGYIVIRESDGHRITNSGKAWPDFQTAYSDFLQHAIFQTATPAKYFPG